MKLKAWTIGVVTALGMTLAGGDVSAQGTAAAQAIKVGSVLALKGKAAGVGNALKDGIEAALRSKTVRGIPLELMTANDSYEPSKAVDETKRLAGQRIVFMMGGTTTPELTVPILQDRRIPAVGFLSGAQFLREDKSGLIVNYRPSYVQEIGTILKAALAAGVKPDEICAYAQNDSYGMAGLAGVREGLAAAKAPEDVLAGLDTVMGITGDNPQRNGIGPVGVYQRNTFFVKPGYLSLKAWEEKKGVRCKFIVTIGAYDNVAHFARNAKKHGEHWVISAVSFTGADNLQHDLEKYGATERILMTQVVPLLTSDLPIVQEAKGTLLTKFNYVSLEGYIIGRMCLQILLAMDGNLTSENFLKQVKASKFDLGGVPINFTDDNQASDQVVLSTLTASGFEVATIDKIREMLVN